VIVNPPIQVSGQKVQVYRPPQHLVPPLQEVHNDTPRDPKWVRLRKCAVATICLAGVLLLVVVRLVPGIIGLQSQFRSTYREAGNWKPAQPNEESLRGNWWKSLTTRN